MCSELNTVRMSDMGEFHELLKVNFFDYQSVVIFMHE